MDSVDLLSKAYRGLLGQSPGVGWNELRYIRAGTGRTPLNPAELAALGALVDRFPLFG